MNKLYVSLVLAVFVLSLVCIVKTIFQIFRIKKELKDSDDNKE
jgi:hypothetical protein